MAYIVYLLYRLSDLILRFLPMWFLYGVSSVLYYLLYHIFGYRKSIARSNMQNCFPEWSEEKINRELKIFYRYFCDLFVESLKGGSISIPYLRSHFKLEDQSDILALEKEGKSGIVLLGHYCNWELGAIRYGDFLPMRSVAVFKALNNKRINDHIKKNRERTGISLWSIERYKKDRNTIFETPSILFLIADQNPTHVNQAFWIPFFDNLLPWYQGPENMAIKHDVPVFFAEINYVSRGKYTISTEKLDFDRSKEGDLTRKFVERLEKQIRKSPNYWLWTHKRWKRAHLFDEKKHRVIQKDD